MNIKTNVGVVFGVIGFIVIVCLLCAFPIKWLWNGCLVGTIDGIHEINAWKALGIGILCGLTVRSHSYKSSKD